MNLFYQDRFTDEDILEVMKVAMPNLQRVQLHSTFVSSRDVIVLNHPNGQKMMVNNPSPPQVTSAVETYYPTFSDLYVDDFNEAKRSDKRLKHFSS